MLGFSKKTQYGYMFARKGELSGGNIHLQILAINKKWKTDGAIDIKELGNVISEIYTAAMNHNPELINYDTVLLFLGKITSETNEKFTFVATQLFELEKQSDQLLNFVNLELKQPVAFTSSNSDPFVMK